MLSALLYVPCRYLAGWCHSDGRHHWVGEQSSARGWAQSLVESQTWIIQIQWWSCPSGLGWIETVFDSDRQLMWDGGRAQPTHGADRNFTSFGWQNPFLSRWWIIFVWCVFPGVSFSLSPNLNFISFPFWRRKTLLANDVIFRKIWVSPLPLVHFSAHLFAFCSVEQLLWDRCWFREQMPLKFYLDFQNSLLHLSDSRWDNIHSRL